MWGRILDNFVIGPYFLYDHLNDNRYLGFLSNALPKVLDDIPDNIKHTMVSVSRCALPFWVKMLIILLIINFLSLDRLRKSRTIACQSPDLTTLNLFLWGTVEDYVFKKEN